MKKLVWSLMIAIVVSVAAPSASRAAGLIGAPGNGQHLGPGRQLHEMHPFDREGSFDHDRRFDRDFRRHGHMRFGYPVCFAYAYCPYVPAPCAWQDGYWLQPPTVYDGDGFALNGVWIPPGCY